MSFFRTPLLRSYGWKIPRWKYRRKSWTFSLNRFELCMYYNFNKKFISSFFFKSKSLSRKHTNRLWFIHAYCTYRYNILSDVWIFVVERRNGWSFAQSGLWSVGDRKQTVFRKDWPEEYRFIGAEADVN